MSELLDDIFDKISKEKNYDVITYFKGTQKWEIKFRRLT